MKKFICLIALFLAMITTLFALASCKTSFENEEDVPVDTTDGNGSTDVDVEVDPFEVSFVLDDHVKVYIYDAQDYTLTPTEAILAYAKDGTTGEVLSDGNGQVNFKIEVDEGYSLLSIDIEGEYKNLKSSADTGVEGVYRITKIASNLVVTITTSKEESAEDLENAYKVEFVLDGDITLITYKTQDYTLEGSTELVAYARDAATAALDTSGSGQVNFYAHSNVAGYQVSINTISIEGSFKNLKDAADTGKSGVYRITKVASDLVVAITLEEKEASPTEITSVYGEEELTLNVNLLSGDAYWEVVDDVLVVDVESEAVISLNGAFNGGIKFVASEEVDLEIDLEGVKIIASDTLPPLYMEGFDNVDISAKANTTNEIIDERDAKEELKAAIYCDCDLKLKGKGSLKVTSDNNNGIHSKDDLEAKNLNLEVDCADNAFKGNDSITIVSGTYTLIARLGDAIKTSNSGTYSSSGTQQGTITISGGTLNLYAACDGIDASYDCIINDSTSVPTINIYTDKYSSYSGEVTKVSDGTYYIRSTTQSYKYAIYYFNSSDDYVWKVASTTPEVVRSGRNTYYYYEVDKPAGYEKMCVYVYTSTQTVGQADTYYSCSAKLSINENYDTIAFNGSTYSWTNKATGNPGGPGGMQEGNPDKGDYSTKGIKADNAILISAGTITIKAYDDAIHANSDNELESGAVPTGNITINGGTLNLYSNDDGIHADGMLSIGGGTINITNSYEGLEGETITINGGSIYVKSSDDGFNAKATTGVGITINDGYIYVNAFGDGLDANTQTSYKGIIFNGGKTFVISNSNANSSLDTEQGYEYNAGYVVAVGKSGGMSSEATMCKNFTSVGKSTTISLTNGNYLVVNNILTAKMPLSISALVVVLGSTSANISQSSSTNASLDANNLCWNV